ncbi:MAG TPA: glutamate-1-semialdehyde 2,1-aminomutase, partial [Polyangiaceae bacterium]
RLMPAGVNSPVRAFRSVGGTPPFISQAHGSKLLDVDGNEYIDYVGSWGPAILGHSHPEVVRTVHHAASAGLSFGAPTQQEVLFAELIVARYPSMEMLRCVSSGTEAAMSAIRLARGFTGRNAIVKFEGAYHGHADSLLVRAGSGAATFGVPDSAGVPAALAELTWTLPYNDTDALRALFEARGNEIACVIVEPVAGNMGCVPPQADFLESILQCCRQSGALSIFDEVMTGCRIGPGGVQGQMHLRPDLTCLGKIVGGGMPLAVYGGRRDVMNLVAPLGPVYQAGTLSGNPVAVAAGIATLTLLDDNVYARLSELGALLEHGLELSIEKHGIPALVQRVGSMFTLFFNASPVQNYAQAAASDRERFARFHRSMLGRGIYWPPSQLEAAFISAAHSEEDIALTVLAAESALLDVTS